MNRKNFIKRCFTLSAVLIGGSTFFTTCGSEKSEVEIEKEKEENLLNCGDNLSTEEKKSRDEFSYEEISTREEEICANCTHFIPASEGKRCGNCEVVKGPINPMGYCKQWFKKVDPNPDTLIEGNFTSVLKDRFNAKT